MTRRTRTFANVSDRDAATQIAGDHGLTPEHRHRRAHLRGARAAQPERPRVPARARTLDRRRTVDHRHDAEPTAEEQARQRPADAHLRQGAARVPGHRRSRYPGHQRRGDGVGRGEQVGDRRARRRRATRRRARRAATAAPACLALPSVSARTCSPARCHRPPRRPRHAPAPCSSGERAVSSSGMGTAQTQPGLRVGATVKLVGLGPLFDGELLRRGGDPYVRRRRWSAHRTDGRTAGVGEAVSDLAEMLIHADVGHAPPSARWPGVYPALVTDIVDPDAQGRVQVSLPWSPDPSGGTYQVWARLATLMGGANRGSWFIPEHGDEVLVGLRRRRPPPSLRARWSVERLRRAAADDGRRGEQLQEGPQDAQRRHGDPR